nr:Copia protein [Ipomoea batatas]
MEGCKSTDTPMNQKEKFSKDDGAEKVDEGQYRSLVGCLMYLTATRPDIMFALLGYSDSNWAGSVDDMKSTTGFCFSFGSAFFSWCSKKQEMTAQSTAEAEYVAANATLVATSSNHSEIISLHEAVKDYVWLRLVIRNIKKLCGLNKSIDTPTVTF